MNVMDFSMYTRKYQITKRVGSCHQTLKNQDKEMICTANRYAFKIQNMVEGSVADP
jgi:hypothetical protein